MVLASGIGPRILLALLALRFALLQHGFQRLLGIRLPPYGVAVHDAQELRDLFERFSFDDGAMTYPETEMPDVAEAAHAVVQEAKDAGVWVFGGGLNDHEEASVVATDRTVTDIPYPESEQYIGGFAVVDVPSRGEALEWAAKIAVACRCA
jgi:hypothetical protein